MKAGEADESTPDKKKKKEKNIYIYITISLIYYINYFNISCQNYNFKKIFFYFQFVYNFINLSLLC